MAELPHKGNATPSPLHYRESDLKEGGRIAFNAFQGDTELKIQLSAQITGARLPGPSETCPILGGRISAWLIPHVLYLSESWLHELLDGSPLGKHNMCSTEISSVLDSISDWLAEITKGLGAKEVAPKEQGREIRFTRVQVAGDPEEKIVTSFEVPFDEGVVSVRVEGVGHGRSYSLILLVKWADGRSPTILNRSVVTVRSLQYDWPSFELQELGIDKEEAEDIQLEIIESLEKILPAILLHQVRASFLARLDTQGNVYPVHVRGDELHVASALERVERIRVEGGIAALRGEDGRSWKWLPVQVVAPKRRRGRTTRDARS